MLLDRSKTWKNYADVRARAEKLFETKQRAYAASYADKRNANENDHAVD